MRRRATIFAALAALLIAGFWVTSSVIGALDPRQEGDVTKVVARSDGGSDIYRSQSNGEVVVEHHEPSGEVWFESNEVLGQDGNPIICPNGEPLRIDLGADEHLSEPSPSEIADAQHGLPDGEVAVFNEYTGQFQVIDEQTYQRGDTTVTAMEPLVYRCGPNNEPALVPLSDVDPAAAARARTAFEEQARNSDAVTGLGSDPARAAGMPRVP